MMMIMVSLATQQNNTTCPIVERRPHWEQYNTKFDICLFMKFLSHLYMIASGLICYAYYFRWWMYKIYQYLMFKWI